MAANTRPGKNNVIAVVVDYGDLPGVSGILRDLKGSRPEGGIKAFVLQVEDTI